MEDTHFKVTELRRASAQAEFMERVRTQTVLAEKLLAALLLVNGGAMVGLFTFIGNMQKRGLSLRLDTALLWWSFWGFVLGLVATLTAFAMAFLSQHHFSQSCQFEIMRYDREALNGAVEDNAIERAEVVAGGKFYAAGIILTFGSIAAFMLGCGLALAGVLPA